MIQWLFTVLWKAWCSFAQRRRLSRAVVWLASVVISGPIFLWVFSEAVVYYEMASTRAQSRAQLGEDLGLGLLFFFIALPAAVMSVVVFAFLSWFCIARWLEDEEEK